MNKIVVGLFDNFQDARDGVQDLVNHGFRREDISMIANDREGRFGPLLKKEPGTEDVSQGAGAGAGIGAVLGGLGGILLGLGALAIPGIGPVLAAGPLISGLVGAGVGAAAGGILGALIDAGIPEEQAHYYAEGIRRGGTLVTVHSPDTQASQAMDILNRHHPVDVKRRSEEWRAQNWKGFDENAGLYQTGTHEQHFERTSQPRMDSLRKDQGDVTLPVVEEELQVGKREVDKGGVHVETTTTETPVEKTVNLREEHVDVERRPVDRPASDADLEAFRDKSFTVTEKAEEAMVDKQARVVEEVHVHKEVEEHPETIRDTVRRQDVNVEHLGPNDLSDYEDTFRHHFTENYSATGRTYDDYAPAYGYGYELANSDRFRGRDWSQIEMDARRDWERRYPQSRWEEFKDAIHEAWLDVTGQR